jgi:hypothetical protein
VPGQALFSGGGCDGDDHPLFTPLFGAVGPQQVQMQQQMALMQQQAAMLQHAHGGFADEFGGVPVAAAAAAMDYPHAGQGQGLDFSPRRSAPLAPAAAAASFAAGGAGGIGAEAAWDPFGPALGESPLKMQQPDLSAGHDVFMAPAKPRSSAALFRPVEAAAAGAAAAVAAAAAPALPAAQPVLSGRPGAPGPPPAASAAGPAAPRVLSLSTKRVHALRPEECHPPIAFSSTPLHEAPPRQGAVSPPFASPPVVRRAVKQQLQLQQSHPQQAGAGVAVV